MTSAETATEDWRPDGIALLADFIAPDQEAAIVLLATEMIDICKDDPLPVQQRRRYARFGYRFDYTQSRRDAPLVQARSIPGPLATFADTVRAALVVSDAFDAIVVAEYAPGGGIHPHIDSSRFAELVAIVSVGEACSITFALEPRSFTLHVPRRSMLIMRGEARYACTHAVEVDPTLERTRYSIVLRTCAIRT